jgi:hypothetical protein
LPRRELFCGRELSYVGKRQHRQGVNFSVGSKIRFKNSP